MSGYNLAQLELLYDLQAPVSTASFTATTVISAKASTSVDRCILPVKYWAVPGKAVKFTFRATVAFATQTTTALFAGLDAAAGTIAGAGGATLFTSGPLNLAAGTYPLDGDFDITASAVGNLGTTLAVNGAIRTQGGTTAGAFSSAGLVAMFANNLTGLNNEAQLWLELFAQNSVSAVGNGITLQQFKVYGEN